MASNDCINVVDRSFRLFVAVGQTLLMMSLAEYCTIWPTAGGQQYYTQAVATGKLRPILSYLVGWAVIVGEISTGSSCALNSAAIIASFVEVTHPEFMWHVSITSFTRRAQADTISFSPG